VSHFFCREPNRAEKGGKIAKKSCSEEDRQALTRLIANQCSPPTEQRPFRLFAVDCTPAKRPFAKTLADRSIVYSPNPAPGNKPIAIGHQYSVLAYLPENSTSHKWVLPLSTQRVPSDHKGPEVGLKQISQLLQDKTLGFEEQLNVVVGDTLYGKIECQKKARSHANLVLVTRMRNNRKVYFPPIVSNKRNKGHPKWYGDKMQLNDEETHQPPALTKTFKTHTRRGKEITIILESWYDMRIRGQKDFPTHKYPFTLVRVRVTDCEGKRIFKHPLWLAVFGQRRDELSIKMISDSYYQRYDIEHYFRFGKQQLLMDAFKTPEVIHEENWWQIVNLAYVQLYLSRELATALPYPWERYLPEYANKKTKDASATQTLRNFPRIVEEIGTPAKAPKRRGISLGRQPGDCPSPREKADIVYKQTTISKPQNKKPSTKGITSSFENFAPSTKPLSYSTIMETLNELLQKTNLTLAEFLEIAAKEVPT